MFGKNTSPKHICLDKKRLLMSTTDLEGKITYANNYFREISSYTNKELIGFSHNILRHPDTPKVIFKMMWDLLQNGEDVLVILKNKTKNGDWYWARTTFEVKLDSENNPIGYTAIGSTACKRVSKKVQVFYDHLLQLEKKDIELPEKYFNEYFKAKNMTYKEWMIDLTSEKSLLDKMKILIIDFLTNLYK